MDGRSGKVVIRAVLVLPGSVDTLVFPQFDGVQLLDSCVREQGAQGWEDTGIRPSSGVGSWT